MLYTVSNLNTRTKIYDKEREQVFVNGVLDNKATERSALCKTNTLRSSGFWGASNFSKYVNVPFFKANSDAPTKSLEKSPDADTLDKSKGERKQDKSYINETIIGLISITLFEILPSYVAYREKKVSIKEIEKKFEALQKNIPRAQKVFKEVFLKENLTEAQTIEILNRYKEIEKIRITGTKNEYIEAVFKEAKSNFGFAKANIPLMIRVSERGNRVAGGASIINTHVEISPEVSLSYVLTCVHHEMRHIKQNYMAVNYDSATFREYLRKHIKVNRTLSEAEWQISLDSCMRKMRKVHNLQSFSRDNIPASQLEYAKKCLSE